MWDEEGRVHCCAVRDTFLQKIAGWSTGEAQDSNLDVPHGLVTRNGVFIGLSPSEASFIPRRFLPAFAVRAFGLVSRSRSQPSSWG